MFEDVAIATYLLLLWDNNHDNASKKPVTFVDIGCGNGLLVYILTKEGHKGLGVDVRKRKIWDMYDSIQLEVSNVVKTLFLAYKSILIDFINFRKKL